MELFESERRVMDVLWDDGEVRAAHIAKVLNLRCGWNRNTTYTLIKKCVDKGLIERSEPGYMCKPLISKHEVQQAELTNILDKYFGGSVTRLFASLMSVKQVSKFELKKMKKLLKKLEE